MKAARTIFCIVIAALLCAVWVSHLHKNWMVGLVGGAGAGFLVDFFAFVLPESRNDRKRFRKVFGFYPNPGGDAVTREAELRIIGHKRAVLIEELARVMRIIEQLEANFRITNSNRGEIIGSHTRKLTTQREAAFAIHRQMEEIECLAIRFGYWAAPEPKVDAVEAPALVTGSNGDIPKPEPATTVSQQPRVA